MAGNSTKRKGITVTVTDQDESELIFKIKTTTKLNRMMTAYEECKGEGPGAFVFLFNGLRLHPNEAPKDVGLEDNDDISAMRQPLGGANADNL